VRRRLAVAVVAAGAAATALLLGGGFRQGSSAAPSPVTARAAAETFETGFSAGGTEELVARLQAELRAAPRDAHALDLLGLAYQQRARETGDPTWYAKSEGVLRRALRLAPNDLLATSGLGSLALSRHRFADALALGRHARRLSPTTARSYGVIGDALVELGRYREAFRAFDHMSALKPSLSSYARISHARELIGDWPGAVSAMKLAIESAIGEQEPTAWTHVQLGKLYWSRGLLNQADRQFRQALFAFPGYVYALDQRAQVEAARGRIRSAIALERRASELVPLPQFVSTLGDLYRVASEERAARREYALIGVIERLLRANGVKTDLETALFEADHGRPSVPLARLARRQRPSIDGDDVLAWTLARSGRCAEALPWSERALRLGTQDALKLFHRGYVEACLGHREAARGWYRRALDLNPYFSIRWAPVARKGVSS
jgi:tetratricopeptide (TPR) repeat protein